jgi:hypothetical protein
LHIFEKEHPKDLRPRQAIEAAIVCIEHNTKKNRDAAWDAERNWQNKILTKLIKEAV